jgi:hypothetical protein
MKNLLACLFVVALSGCASFYDFAGIHSFIQVHGRDVVQCEFPVKVRVHHRLSNNYVVLVKEALAQWNHALGFEGFVFDGVTFIDALGHPEETMDFTVVQQATYIVAPHQESLGWTDVRTVNSTGCVVNSDVFLTVSLFERGDLRLAQTVILHEFGHVLGLEHRNSSGCIMRTQISSEFGTEEVSDEEIEALKERY